MNIASIPKRTASLLWAHKWKTLLAVVILVPLVLGVRAATAPKKTQYVTATVEQGDLTQTVEAVGTVTSDRNLDLQFKSAGIVAQVYVKEGDRVSAGQRLAALKAGNLGAGVAVAAASVREAQANLQALREGARPEDIAITAATVENKRALLNAAKASLSVAEQNLKSAQDRLTALKSESSTALGGQVALAVSLGNQKLTRAEQSVAVIDDVFSRSDVNDAVIKDNPGQYDALKKQEQQAKDALAAIRKQQIPNDYQGALQLLAMVRAAVTEASSVMDAAYQVVSNVPETSYFTSSDRETLKASLASERNTILATITDIDTGVKSLQDASATYQTRIATEEANITTSQGAMEKAQADIQTYQTSLEIDEAQLNLKKAGARQTDIDAALARVRSAQASLARAAADYGDTVITAPVGGVITKVDIKPGEASPLGPAITLLGTSPYRIEMYVSEVDIPKVSLSQTGSVELDAFRDKHFQLRVSEIASGPTEVSGVNKYKVKLDFVYPHPEIKIGMTGDAEIVSASRTGVLSVPLRAVLQDADGKKLVRVVKSDGTLEDRYVETGIEGANGNVEIVSGLKRGEKVVVLEKK